MTTPLVTVVIPTYNSAEFLPATLDSVLAQTYSAIEIIVVDDGSTDDTVSVLKPYMGQIRYIRQDNWGGPSRPRNIGVDAAGGELVAFFDSDDLMMPEKIADSAGVLADNPRVGLVFSNFQGISEQELILVRDFLAGYVNFRDDLIDTDDSEVKILPARKAYSQLLKANFIGTSSVVCRKTVFVEAGTFDEEMLNADDVDMWRRIAYAGFDFAYVDRILHSYRKREGGVTDRGVRRYPSILRGLAKQLELELEPRERRLVEDRLLALRMDYGSALCDSGAYADARRIFGKILAEKTTLRGIKGWLKAVVSGWGA